MHYTIPILLSFTSALISTFFLLNRDLYTFVTEIILNKELVIIPAIILTIFFLKKIIGGFKRINRYSWLIIVCYLSGTLTMDYQTYTYSVPFQGVLITLPWVLAFIYWSQKNTNILLSQGLNFTKKNGFKFDLFLITTSFLLSGYLSLIMDLNNIDLRGWWPFVTLLISLYGFLFSLIFSITGLLINNNHKKYTLIFSAIIMFIYSSLKFFPKNIFFLNLMKVETFYVISITLLSAHFLLILACLIKNNLLKIKSDI